MENLNVQIMNGQFPIFRLFMNYASETNVPSWIENKLRDGGRLILTRFMRFYVVGPH